MKDTKINLITLLLTLLATLLLVSCGREQAAGEKVESSSDFQEAIEVTEASAGTILVPIDYKEEQWFVGEKGVTVLPCEPPTPFYSGSEIQPLIQIMDANGEVVYERNEEADPRVLDFEQGPTDQPHILEEVSFSLRLPLLAGMQTMEYTVAPGDEEVREEQEPDLIVDLGPALEDYEAAGAAEQEAPCQQPAYKPDQLEGEK
jgi:hypothetical protein